LAYFKIVKKLKLTGTPFKVHRHTAFIRGMFHSALEVAKFEGAAIKTVSGIRGQIKKALLNEGPEGSFRATFEDKILMSDIVFCRTWTTVNPKEYYNPVTSLLLPDKQRWRETSGMRVISELRRQKKIPIPVNPDSAYREIQRAPRTFNPLKVPATLQKELPFKSKPKLEKKRASHKRLYEHKRAVVMDAETKRALNLFNDLSTIKNDKMKKKLESQKVRKGKVEKKRAKEEAARAPSVKEKRKRKYIAEAKGKPLKYARYGPGL